MNPQKKAELIHKAQREFHEYLSDGEQPTPQPQRRQPPQPEQQADDVLSQKMQMYKEIQERVKGSSALQSLGNKGSLAVPRLANTLPVQSLENQENIYYNTNGRQNTKMDDSDDDLVYSLNQKSSVRVDNKSLSQS